MAEEKKKKGKGKKDKARDPKNPYGNYEFDRSKKVTQATIDKVKDTARKDGIAAAIQKHGGSDAEAVKRLYGQNRYNKYFKGNTGSSSSRSGTTRPSGTIAPRPSSAGPKMGGGVGRTKSTSNKSTTRRNIGAAGAGAAALYAAAYQQAKKPLVGAATNRPRANSKLPAGRTARTAYNNAIKAGKTSAAALTAARAAVKKVNAAPVSKSKATAKAVGRVGGRLLGAAGAPILARDAIMAASGGLKKGISKTRGGKEALARYERSGGPGAGRAKQMSKVRRKGR
jgi:hypothetical protein